MKYKKHVVTMMDGLETYRIGSEAIITLQPSTGYVSVSCPHYQELNGCHWWTHRGNYTLHEFLIDLHADYTMNKLFDSRKLEEYDEDQTKKDIRDYVINLRVNNRISKIKARDIWTEVEYVETMDDIARLEGIECPYEFIRHKDKWCVAWFWNEVWFSFIEHLKEKK